MVTYKLLCGDSREKLLVLPNNSIDSIVTDPPYELGFMGKKWDASGIAYSVPLWTECLRVLKPGGHLLAFGGTRTHHRMTCAIEDAGFEIRDELDWVYGSGFPKSLNLKDEWKGWGTALKPAREPIVLARKPLESTVAENIQKYGTGGLNIDGCRIAYQSEDDNASATPQGACTSAAGDAGTRPNVDGKPRVVKERPELKGRWPANIIFDEDAAAELDTQSGIQKSGVAVQRNGGGQAIFGGIAGNAGSKQIRDDAGYGDIGGASRFFYVAKASRGEREAGCEHLPVHTAKGTVGRDPESAGAKNPRAGAMRSAGASIIQCQKCHAKVNNGRHSTVNAPCKVGGLHDWQKIGEIAGVRNYHPTVKPIELMRYLVRLVTQKGGVVLDPFTGSGSTGCACALEGMNFIGIELDKGHAEIAKARIDYWKTQPTESPKIQKKSVRVIAKEEAELPL